MKIATPPDRVLGARASALLDGDAVAARLGAFTGEPVRCTPRYARYKPGTSLLVQYDVAVGSAHALAHAWLFADGRAARTWQSASFARLVERTRRRHPGLPLVAAFLDDLAVLVEVSPLDSRLPALARAASGRKLARAVGAVATPALRKAHAQIVRHKPGRKALLRFDALYVKVHGDGRARAHAALADAVAAAGVPTARPLAHVRELGAVVYPELVGRRLADLRASGRYARSLPSVAAALAGLHRAFPGPSRPGEHARLVKAGRAVDALVPGLSGGRLAADVARRLDAVRGPTVLAHGDFYDDQLLVGQEGVWLLDLDEARPGHPLLDVGNFLAHLSAQGQATARPAFLDACDRAGFDLDGVLAFEAAGLLALAVGPFRRLEPGWPERVRRLVELARERLGEDRRRRPNDPRLAQLRVLGDPDAARAPLSRALGHRVDVAAVKVVRHKVGRRCTLRYGLGDGRTVFGKTYASARAGRVYDALLTLAAAPDVRAPAPLGWDAAARLVVTAPLEGEPVLARVRAGDSALGVEIADALFALHASGVELERRHTLIDELEPLHDRVEQLAERAPALAPAARRGLELALAGGARSWTWRFRPVHRDFYEDQLLAGPDGLRLLDLDDAAMSEPAVDVANLAAHLRLRGLRPAERASGPAAVSRAFLRRYRSLDPELDPALVSLLVGSTLLRLAEIHLSRGGADLAGRLLAGSERLLRRAR